MKPTAQVGFLFSISGYLTGTSITHNDRNAGPDGTGTVPAAQQKTRVSLSQNIRHKASIPLSSRPIISREAAR
jgi:hypothetical protein